MATHTYFSHLVWEGSTGGGYRSYTRDHRGVTPPALDEIGLSADASTPARIDTIDLSPTIRVAPGTDPDQVLALVEQAHHGCYIANSLNTDIRLTPTIHLE